MSEPPQTQYRATNQPTYNASLKRRDSLMVWFDRKLAWQVVLNGRAGLPTVFSDAAVHYCLTLKCMFGLGLRQATGLAKRLLKLD